MTGPSSRHRQSLLTQGQRTKTISYCRSPPVTSVPNVPGNKGDDLAVDISSSQKNGSTKFFEKDANIYPVAMRARRKRKKSPRESKAKSYPRDSYAQVNQEPAVRRRFSSCPSGAGGLTPHQIQHLTATPKNSRAKKVTEVVGVDELFALPGRSGKRRRSSRRRTLSIKSSRKAESRSKVQRQRRNNKHAGRVAQPRNACQRRRFGSKTESGHRFVLVG